MWSGIRFLLFLAASAVGTGAIFAQGDRCSTIQPFCAGDAQLIFENSSSADSDMAAAERGPNYGCLSTQPYPAWFYLQIDTPGNLEFDIRQSENPDGSGLLYDVDFIVWGPFDPAEEYCSSSQLSAQNTVDCSYSPSAVETMQIYNAREGQIYVVLITNFSELPGYIRLQQTNSSAGGSTDCSIVNSALGPDQKLCGVDEYVLDAENEQATDYTWSVFDEATGDFVVIPGETGPTLTVTTSGRYQITVFSDILNDEESDEVLIEFFDVPVAETPSPVFGCTQGEELIFDLTAATAEMIDDNKGSYTSFFFLTREDLDNFNPISNPERFISSGEQNLLGIIVGEESGCASQPVTISLSSVDFPQINFPETTAFCVDLRAQAMGNISLGEDLGPGYLYDWNIPNDPDGDGIENAVLNLNSFPSQNPITLSITHIESGCVKEYSTSVEVFSPPLEVVVGIEGSDFEGGYTITATASHGFGSETTYEYKLDNGPWQMSNVFTAVGGGSHIVTAREINGCGSNSSAPFRLLGYPRFFTPNNDGYNDSWNITDLGSGAVGKILIFDRYGKLLKELQPLSAGWDGTYNNQPMPADDYWFSVEIRDEETGQIQNFKANFTLKR